MAILYITEFSNQGLDHTARAIPIAEMPPIAEQTVPITASSTTSNALNAQTDFVRLHPDSICSVSVSGTSPTATTTTARMIAGQTEYYAVPQGASYKVAVISNS